MMEALIQIIDVVLSSQLTSDDDKMLGYLLGDIRHKIWVKLDRSLVDARLNLTPAEAVALRILSTDYVSNITTAVGNRLNQISNEVHRIYL